MEFKQLNSDKLPINISTDFNSIDYKNQLNLVFNTTQVLNNIEDYLGLLSKKVNQSPNTVKTLNLTLESYLYVLLTTSTISNSDSSKLSSFYSRKKKIDLDYFQSIDSVYLENLNYTNYRVWGGNFGSLGYYLYLAKSTLHYSHPSNLVRLSTLGLINDLNLPDYQSKLISLITSDRVESDYNLYSQSSSLLKELDFTKAINQLKFYESWLTELMIWYSSISNSPIINPHMKNTSAYKAFALLVEMSQSLARLGLYLDSFISLPYKFLHQEIDLLVLEGIQTVNTLRKLKQFEVTTDLTPEEILINKLFISGARNSSEFITAESYRLLSFNLVGGLNMWFTTLAAELINRAYILTYNQFSNSLLYPLEKSEDLINFMDRVYKLIFYAGYCLKKTNLNHLQIIGFNLRILSQLEDDTNIQEYDLLT
jgi:hypothetical protein